MLRALGPRVKHDTPAYRGSGRFIHNMLSLDPSASATQNPCMTDLSLPFGGHCLCGAIRYTCDAPPLWQAHCHCESCRRATSSPFTACFAVADGHWRWTGAKPAAFNSGPGAGVRRSCYATCGSQMTYRADDTPGDMHLWSASLDAPRRFAPTHNDFDEEALPWVRLDDGLPRR